MKAVIALDQVLSHTITLEQWHDLSYQIVEQGQVIGAMNSLYRTPDGQASNSSPEEITPVNSDDDDEGLGAVRREFTGQTLEPKEVLMAYWHIIRGCWLQPSDVGIVNAFDPGDSKTYDVPDTALQITLNIHNVQSSTGPFTWKNMVEGLIHLLRLPAKENKWESMIGKIVRNAPGGEVLMVEVKYSRTVSKPTETE